MTELIAALNVAFPPTAATVPFPPFTVQVHQFTVQGDGTVFLVNPTPERLATLAEVIAANPLT